MFLTGKEILSTIPRIYSFNDIPLEPRTLVLCDIDDTVLHFPERESFLKQMYDDLVPNFGEEAARKEVHSMYALYAHVRAPSHTDPDGFARLEERLVNRDGMLAFLTARNERDDRWTRDHLAKIGINEKKYKVLYTNNEMSKGEFIKTRLLDHGINLGLWTHVVFVDDREDYLVSVKRLFPYVKCYQFVIRK